ESALQCAAQSPVHVGVGGDGHLRVLAGEHWLNHEAGDGRLPDITLDQAPTGLRLAHDPAQAALPAQYAHLHVEHRAAPMTALDDSQRAELRSRQDARMTLAIISQQLIDTLWWCLDHLGHRDAMPWHLLALHGAGGAIHLSMRSSAKVGERGGGV